MNEGDEIRMVLEKMAFERERLLPHVATLTEEEAATPPAYDAEGEAEWTVKEQLAHMRIGDSQHRRYVERAMAEDDPDVTGQRPTPGIVIEDANNHSIEELLDAMAAERRLVLDLVATVEPGHLTRTATRADFGPLTVLQWLRAIYRHDRMHYEQIMALEPTYRPRYLSGVERDQRKPRRGRQQEAAQSS